MTTELRVTLSESLETDAYFLKNSGFDIIEWGYGETTVCKIKDRKTGKHYLVKLVLIPTGRETK